MSRILCASVAAVLLALAADRAAAQCQGPKGVRLTPYNTTCPFFSQHAKLGGAYDPTSCTLTLTLTRSGTCCNTFARTQLLMLGVTPIIPGRPDPVLVPGCVLSLQPLVVLAQPVSAGGTWRVKLPPVPAPTAIYLQGVNHYFTTIGMTHDFQSSNGLRLDLT